MRAPRACVAVDALATGWARCRLPRLRGSPHPPAFALPRVRGCTGTSIRPQKPLCRSREASACSTTICLFHKNLPDWPIFRVLAWAIRPVTCGGPDATQGHRALWPEAEALRWQRRSTELERSPNRCCLLIRWFRLPTFQPRGDSWMAQPCSSRSFSSWRRAARCWPGHRCDRLVVRQGEHLDD
jgi:hypothetical protein